MAFTQTRNDIIKKAFNMVGIRNPSNDQYQEGSDFLNIEINAIQNEGIYLWKTNENVYSLTASSVVKNNLKSYRCVKGHTSASVSEPGTGSDWAFYWTEVTYDATHAAWALSTAYTSVNEVSLGSSVIDVSDVLIRETGGLDYPVQLISYEEYMGLQYKYSEERSYYAYLEKNGTITNGHAALTLRFYPHFSDTTNIIVLREYLNITESESNATALDAIKRAYKMLVYSVASGLAEIYDDEKVNQIERKYRNAKRILLDFYNDSDDLDVIKPYY